MQNDIIGILGLNELFSVQENDRTITVISADGAQRLVLEKLYGALLVRENSLCAMSAEKLYRTLNNALPINIIVLPSAAEGTDGIMEHLGALPISFPCEGCAYLLEPAGGEGVFYHTEVRDYSAEDIASLLHSVYWDLDTDPEVLRRAMLNATRVTAAWHRGRMVGIIRSMDDDCWSANIDCLVVHSEYQGRGVGSSLIRRMLDRTGHIMNISLSPNDPHNNTFYFKFGFQLVEGSSLLQKYN